ncbi:Membrane metallo-endopeptidase-like 1 [Halotydeus destructor]|nr:Membrane metallo-endopeptidase-like 1 [Halotydeus destructor]
MQSECTVVTTVIPVVSLVKATMLTWVGQRSPPSGPTLAPCPSSARFKWTLVAVAMLVVTLAITVSLVVALVTIRNLNDEIKLKEDICLSQECIQASSQLMANMDVSIDPCDDFYQYSCGRWSSRHPIPEDKSNFDTFGVMKDELKDKLSQLLTEAMDDSKDSTAIKNAKTLYQSCMNESAIEAVGSQPLVSFLKDTFRGWPVLDGLAEDDQFDWVQTTAKLRQLNNDVLIGQWVGPDTKNSTVNIIQLDQPDLGMPSKEYFQDGSAHLTAYYELMVQVALLLGAKDVDRVRDEMNDTLTFEKKLAAITIPADQRRNYSAIYKKMTLDELSLLIPGIPWIAYVSASFQPITVHNGSEQVLIYAVDYFEKLSALIKNASNRTLKNYLLWRFIYNRIGNLDKRFTAKQQEYFRTLYGTERTPQRSKMCSNYVNKNMGMAVGALFVQRYFDEKFKKTADEMIGGIKDAFLQLVQSNDWMDDDTKKMAIGKALIMGQKIGYPDLIANQTELDKEYSGLDFTAEGYFENVIQLLESLALKERSKLREVVDRDAWVTSPAVVNAFYTRSKNFISFPAGILQPPLYHPEYPNSLNYGGIGVVIGHEITHGFDDKGRQFDGHGNLVQWWAAKALDNFQRKAMCIINQYSNYTVPQVDIRVNGVNTQGENIADNGGLKQAFLAYRKWLLNQKESDKKLPGLQEMSHEQLFFLNYAQIWCGSSRPEAVVNAIRTSSHSPGRFRVIGALSNSAHFADAFKCSLGSPMNPVHKCDVW